MSVWVTEYVTLSKTPRGTAPQGEEPALKTTRVISTDATATTTSGAVVLDPRTQFFRIIGNAGAIHMIVTISPATATPDASNMRLFAGVAEYFGVVPNSRVNVTQIVP